MKIGKEGLFQESSFIFKKKKKGLACAWDMW